VDRCEVCGRREATGLAYCVEGMESTGLCREHYRQVKDYIEGLKPKPTTVVEKRLMNYVAFDRAAPWGERRISFSDADALYEHMRRERKDA